MRHANNTTEHGTDNCGIANTRVDVSKGAQTEEICSVLYSDHDQIELDDLVQSYYATRAHLQSTRVSNFRCVCKQIHTSELLNTKLVLA